MNAHRYVCVYVCVCVCVRLCVYVFVLFGLVFGYESMRMYVYDVCMSSPDLNAPRYVGVCVYIYIYRYTYSE